MLAAADREPNGSRADSGPGERAPADRPGRPGEPGTPGASGTEHALRALELPRVLELVARHATGDLGAERVRSLRPLTDLREARRELATADEMASFLLRDDRWAPPPIPDTRAAVGRLPVEASVLDPAQLRDVGVLLASSRKARTGVLRWSSEFERLGELAAPLVKEPELEDRLLASVDEAGEVTDAASAALGRVRRELRDARNALVSRLEEHARGLPDRYRVPDASVTVRGGRYCIPIRREGRSEVGGLVHDESASRQTLYVEPPLAIEPMNRIRELELEERREVRRVLEELTDRLRPLAEGLRATLDALVTLDALFARARYALEHGGHRPEISRPGSGAPYLVEEAVHPILLDAPDRAVPFDLELREEERVLLVSGPNAGGKTVLLKTIGLLSAISQAGIVPPVGPRTRLPFFRRFFAVIGDEQSIEASLSTFSAQVENLREILAGSDARSLVLVDEIGGSTDPAEGAALAAAVLVRLAEQAGLTVATTHLGALKTLAEEDERVVNASLQFDAAELRPTYRLERDRPGRSYALEIARRLGLPEDVLAEARSRLSREDRAVEELLAELQERQEEAERLTAELRRRSQRLAERGEVLEERSAELDRRERKVEREAREREERYLLDARERVEEAIDRLESRYAGLEDAAAGEEAETVEARHEARSRARAEVERAVREAREGKPESLRREEREPPADLEEGERVRIRSVDRAGRVTEVRGDRVVVSAGGVRLTVPTGDVERVEEAGDAPRASRRERSDDGSPAAGGRRPEIEARPQVDLRGLRVHEVEGELLTALDAAVVEGLARLRIVHGKGTGALRTRVRELLEADGRVVRIRGGDPGEGGAGVTVAVLREDGGTAGDA